MKLKILPKLLLYILLPSIIGLCSMATMDYINSRDAMANMIRDELNFVAKGQQGEFSNIFIMLNGIIKTLAKQADVVELLGTEAAMDASTRAALLDAVRLSLADAASNFTRIKDIAMVDRKGTVLIHSSDQKFVGTDVSSRPYVKTALAGKTGLTTLQSQVTKKLTTALSHPVIYNKEIVGLIYLTLNLEELSQATVETIKVANTGLCFVIDSNGQAILHPDKKLVGINMSDLPWVRNLKNLQPGHFTYEWEGVRKIGNFQPVPEAGWTVIMGVERDDILTPITNMLQYSLIVVSILVLILIIIIFLVAYSFANILKKLALLVKYIGAGNFRLDDTQRQDLDKTKKRGDEISTLAEGVDLMTDNLKSMFTEAEEKTEEARQATEKAQKATEAAEAARAQAEHAKRDGMLAAAAQLETVVENLTSASAELSAQIEQSERGASEQADRITHTATAMDEMTATVLEVAQNASKASELSIETRAKASTGANLVEASLSSMRQVQKFSVALKTDMEQLNDKAQSISHIMGVISDIADQTNLLALNAAIEAARAGDAGRGFAVVADEVRKLAEKTMGSTIEVGKAIKDIQASTSQSMQQVDTTVQHIEQTTEQSQQSGTALKEIVEMIDTTVDQVRSIATASEEQSATSQEINQAITDVNNVSAETARAMQEASHAVEDLARQAQNLNTLISQMKEA